MNRTPDKWLKLMLHMRNAPPAIHHCIFPNADASQGAANRMRNVARNHPTWCPMTIIQRGCDVWVIKEEFVQKVVINDE